MDRRHIYRAAGIGAKIADKVTETVGSWRFILIQSFVLASWIVLNSLPVIFHWDAAPFILLNLMLSFQAAFTGPFVLMSQNRQAERDRKRDDHEAAEVDEMFSNHRLLMSINQQMFEVNKQQLEILRRLDHLEHAEDEEDEIEERPCW